MNACDLADAIGFTSVSAYGRVVLAGISLSTGDFADAERYGREGLALGLQYDMRGLVAQQRGVLGLIAILQGRVAEGREELVAAREVLRSVPGQVQAALLLGQVTALAAVEGRTEDAVLAAAVSDTVLQRLGLASWPMYEQSRRGLTAGHRTTCRRRRSPRSRAEAASADPWEVLDRVLGLPR